MEGLHFDVGGDLRDARRRSFEEVPGSIDPLLANVLKRRYARFRAESEVSPP